MSFVVWGLRSLVLAPDSVASHKRFAEKHNLRVTLLSDPDKRVIKMFGAWGKKRYGKRVTEGVIRSTFLVDPSGKVVKIWRGVRVAGHAEEVLAALKELVGG